MNFLFIKFLKLTPLWFKIVEQIVTVVILTNGTRNTEFYQLKTRIQTKFAQMGQHGQKSI